MMYGLVVCGGKSTRMGTDKSMLNYHGQPQRYHLYDMLSTLCDRVFISCNREQAGSIPDKYSVIVDDEEYTEIGPMAAVLTAFRQHPEASLLVIGCDYPFLKSETLQNLIKASLQSIKCISLSNTSNNFIEPLLTVYQNYIISYLENKFRQNEHSLRIALEEYGVDIIEPLEQIEIKSIDTVGEYQKVMMQLYK